LRAGIAEPKAGKDLLNGVYGDQGPRFLRGCERYEAPPPSLREARNP